MQRYLLGFVTVCIIAMCGGCHLLSQGRVKEHEADARAEYFGEPVARPGLMLSVVVTASGSAAVDNMKCEVDATGNILLPLIGAVSCDGLSLLEMQEKIKEAYKAYFIEPQVTVSFMYQPNANMKSPWGSVLLQGEVVREGPVDMPSTRDLTVTRAIMLAGGATPLAAKTRVLVSRREKDGALTQFKVDLEKIGKEGRGDLDMVLRPGDVIYVPESWY